MENKCSEPSFLLLLFLAWPARWGGLLFLAWPALPGLLDGGAYPFAEKPKYHFLPPKIPANFSKK